MNKLEQLGFVKANRSRYSKGNLDIMVIWYDKKVIRCADGKFAYENKKIMDEFYNDKEITEAIRLLEIELGFTKAGWQ